MAYGTDFLHYELNHIGPNQTIQVVLDSQAYVRLMDYSNYISYLDGRQYNYYGGLVKVSPYKLKPPFLSNWHLIIDLGGDSGYINAQVKILN